MTLISYYFNEGLRFKEKVLLLPWSANCFVWLNLDSGNMETVSSKLAPRDIVSKFAGKTGEYAEEREGFSFADYICAFTGVD